MQETIAFCSGYPSISGDYLPPSKALSAPDPAWRQQVARATGKAVVIGWLTWGSFAGPMLHHGHEPKIAQSPAVNTIAHQYQHMSEIELQAAPYALDLRLPWQQQALTSGEGRVPHSFFQSGHQKRFGLA